jgi:serine/threonine protein kinase
MEYADGGSLRDYLKENFDMLTWRNKVSFAYQLACAVSCLHDEGIIHRDLVFINFILKQFAYLFIWRCLFKIYF